LKKLPDLPEEVVANHLSPFEKFLYLKIKEEETTVACGHKPKNSNTKTVGVSSNVK
jgi:hypothetical protein